LVDGHRIPDSIAAHRAVELCNTRAAWGDREPKEYLVDYPTLAVWARENRLVTPVECSALLAEATRRPTAARVALDTTLELRDSLYTVFTDRNVQVEATARIRDSLLLAVRDSRYRLDPEDASLSLDGGSGLALPERRCVLAAHRLLESYGPSSVGRCGGVGCGWLFFDPAHRRRWCIMAVCGNRAKARRYAQRRAQ
jgi:predicted RNA-binding Zn ribbon-like protein